jgi:hypothetical protein
MTTSATNSLKDSLRESSEYQTFTRIVKTVRATLIIDKILKEAEFLHQNRKSRSLHARKLSALDLQEAILNDMANRSRLTELRSLLSRQYELLGTAIETIKRHIRFHHRDDVDELAPKVGDKTALIDMILQSPLKTKSEIAGASEVLDIYIKDIDQAGYALRNSVDLLKLILDRRGLEQSI